MRTTVDIDQLGDEIAELAAHERGFRVKSDGAGAFQFFRPDGREVTAVSVPSNVPGNPVETLRPRRRAVRLTIDAVTGFSALGRATAGLRPRVFCLVGANPQLADGCRGGRAESVEPARGARGDLASFRGPALSAVPRRDPVAGPLQDLTR